MNTNINKYESKKAFTWAIFILLLGTNFLGLMPFAGYVNNNTKPVILVKCIIFLYFAIRTYDPRDKFNKWLIYLWIAFFLNKFSSVIFRNQNLSNVLFQGSFIYDFGFYYIISYINPSVRQIEKVISYLGLSAIIIYFIQYAVLPTPIVESLSESWRSQDFVSEFDIQRFTITGEAIIILYGLLSFNLYLLNKKKKYIIVILVTFIFIILHGYRSMMIAYAIAFLFLYFKINGFKLNKTTFCGIILLLTFAYLLNFTSLFDNIFATISEKNEYQSSLTFQELDRVVEWNYFYENINKPWEWLLGAGFIGKNFTDQSIFINWVDLGFIGMSFMGGILLTYCWIKLLLLNIHKPKANYTYIAAFSIYVILATITLNIAFADKCIVIQSLSFYLYVKLNMIQKNESCILSK